MYIGRAVELRRRVRSYWGSQRGRPRMRRMVPQIVRVEVLTCASEHEAAWLERNLLEQSKPRWNRARGGLEVPVYLRLDASPLAPSLTITHDVLDDDSQGSYFGPYLGGTRVRTAASALGSLYPIAYTGERLSGAERSMAEARKVGPADRDAFVDTLTRLLDRDADAADHARVALMERRERAARDLEFELAGRAQEQLTALDWLVSSQRVTSQEPFDATVAGWADGVLVEFAIKGGRIRTWTQRTCSADDAARAVAASPEAWTEFATENAVLAAQLGALHAA